MHAGHRADTGVERGAGVCDGVRGGVFAERGQPVRVPADIRVLQRAGHIAEAGADLGHPGGDGDARCDDPHGHGTDAALQGGDSDVRGAAAVQRVQAAVGWRRRRRRGPVEQRHREVCAPRCRGHRPLRRRPLLHRAEQRARGHASAARAGMRRAERHRVRARQRARRARHLRRHRRHLPQQHPRHHGPPQPVLHPRRVHRRPALPVQELGHRPRLRRLQDGQRRARLRGAHPPVASRDCGHARCRHRPQFCVS